METTDLKEESDIATESYKGPGALVTGAGEGAITHYGTGLGGLIAGGAVGYGAYKKVNHIETGFQNFYQANKDGGNILKRGIAKLAGFTRWAAHKSVEHLPGREKLFARIPAERLEAVVFGAGVAGFAGFFLAPIYFMFTGAKHSRDGRKQFERAQEEILTTRAERDALRQKYAESQVELEGAKAKTAEPAAAVAKDTVEQTDSPTHPTPPVITAPPIGNPNWPQKPNMPWWDGKEKEAAKPSTETVHREEASKIEESAAKTEKPPASEEEWGEHIAAEKTEAAHTEPARA